MKRIRFKIILSTSLIFLFSTGCSVYPDVMPKETRETQRHAVASCITGGGVPRIDFWSGMVTDCIYPPATTIDYK